MGMQYKWYVGIILGAIGLQLLQPESVIHEMPFWWFGGALIFFMFMAGAMQWEAWRRSADLTLTTLGVGKGSSDGFNPVDYNMVASPNRNKYACIATGGFVTSGFAWEGHNRFIVCPVELVHKHGGNLWIMANLHKVDYESLPKYVQQGLGELKCFNEKKAQDGKYNDKIYFGALSGYYGNDTAENMKLQNVFIDQTTEINTLRSQLQRKKEQEKKKDNFIFEREAIE